MSLSPNLRGAGIMTAAMAGFAVSDACMKGLEAHWPLFQSILLRGCGTTLLLGLLAWRLGQLRAVGRRDAGLILLCTAFEMVAGWCYLTGLNLLPLANIAAIQQAVPLTVTLGALLVLGERVRPSQMAAIVVGLCGVLLILQPGGEGFTWASLYGLGSVLATAGRDLASRAISPAAPSILVATAASTGMAALGAGGAAFVDWRPVTAEAAPLLLGTIGFVVMAYVASVSAMRVGEVATVTPFRYTALLMAMGLGVLFFGTVPDAPTLWGAAVVVGTGLFTLLRERARARAAADAAPPGG